MDDQAHTSTDNDVNDAHNRVYEANIDDLAQNEAAVRQNEYTLNFDGDNSYPDCRCCGQCCARINILCVSQKEVDTIYKYIKEHHITPTDYHKEHCCFMRSDGRCDIWEVRPQTCRLYNCHVPRKIVLQSNPHIVVDNNKPLIDMHDAFIKGDTSDPRERSAMN